MNGHRLIYVLVPAKSQIIFLDAAYSGVEAPVSAHPETSSSKDRAVLSSTSSTGVAIESGNLQHSVFAYFLLQGLSGKADLNGDGVITIEELSQYVEASVARESTAVGFPQRPELFLTGSKSIALPQLHSTRSE
jgi:hypothetical protein